jgi:hypothetical protein
MRMRGLPATASRILRTGRRNSEAIGNRFAGSISIARLTALSSIAGSAASRSRTLGAGRLRSVGSKGSRR